MRTLSLIILATWVLALARTLLNLITVPRLRPRMPRRTPLVSAIVPARNEERTIGRTVEALLAQTYPSLEVIVIDDRSSDATGAILGAIDDPRLVVIQGEETPAGWLGKPWALEQGSRRAGGELLLFLDADVIYAPEAIASAVAHLEESGVAMVSLFPRFELHGFWEHVLMPNLAMVLFMFMPVWFGNRTRFPYLGVGGGPGNLVRRDDYDAAGRHEALHDAVVDDVGLARLIRRAGHRTEVVRADDLVSLRMYHGLGEIIDGFTKNCFAAFGRSYVAGLLAIVLTVLGNLWPFALLFTGDPFGIAIVAVILLARLVLYVALGYGVANALLAHPPMMLIWGWIMLRSVWVTGVRRRVHWRGRTYDAKHTG